LIERVTPPLADEEERDAIRNRLETTMLVEAAAGTGKTTIMVDRMVNLVRSRTADVGSIAAITFTLKAAAHLREKFQEGLERAELGAAVADLNRGFIGTTHAFCARLLRERPVEAGLDPEFSELDETAAVLRTADYWNSWYEHEVAAGNPLVADASEVGLTMQTLRQPFEMLAANPDVIAVSERVPRPDLRPACESVLAMAQRVEPHLPQQQDREQQDDFHKLILGLLRSGRSSDFEDVDDQVRFLDEANYKSRKPTQYRWPDGKLAKSLHSEYVDLVSEQVEPALRQWREHVHGIAVELLRPAVESWAMARRRAGTLTFQDLLMCTRDLLRDHPDVRRSFQRRFSHLLVDEFQDTDPIQAEIVFYLTAGDPSETNWRRAVPRPGSLFIVGDPKQSIYRFRRADIMTYREVARLIEASGGEIRRLSTNFRSLEPVCELANRVFAAEFTGGERQAEFVGLDPHRRERNSLSGVFRLETQKTARESNEEIAENEAETIAGWIRNAEGRLEIDDEIGSRPLRWKDVLIVTWQRPRLTIYTAALERAGIPYEVTGTRAFSQSEEIAALLPLLRAVADPEDAVSVVAYLRGPLCGIDDDALYRFARAGGKFTLTIPLPDEIDGRLREAMERASQAAEEARTLPPAAVVARLIDRLGVVSLAFTADRGGTRAGALLLALAKIREMSARGVSLADAIAEIERFVKESAEIEELDVSPSRDNVVRLMNLHQVKGLEAPVVFLADPNRPFNFPIDLHVDRAGEAPRAFVRFHKKLGRSKAPIAQPRNWQAYEEEEKLFKAAEDVRLRYVAATRARNILVVGVQMSAKGAEIGPWCEIARGIASTLPTLPPKPLSETETVQRRDLIGAREEIAGRYERAAAQSYSVVPVTKIAHSHGTLVKVEEGLGRGTSWGRVLHRLFEAMLLDERLDIRHYAENLLRDEEREVAEIEDVIAAANALRNSGLWRRVVASEEKYAEVPFAVNVPARSLGLDREGDTLLHGTIDLVFREGEQWHIVDYKSDSTMGEGRLESLVAYYKPQVEHYARFWSELTGAPTVAGLFFVDGCVERWM
jgi:ATP-dependent helicase/nuclease subunit A